MGAQFEQLLAEAEQHEFCGWDFSFMDGRWHESPPTWDYRAMILERLERVHCLMVACRSPTAASTSSSIGTRPSCRRRCSAYSGPGEAFSRSRSAGVTTCFSTSCSGQQDFDLYADWDLGRAVDELEDAGLRVTDAREEFPKTVFDDVGAIVYYLKAVPWQIEGFSVDDKRESLLALHESIRSSGNLVVTSHRFFIEAKRR